MTTSIRKTVMLGSLSARKAEVDANAKNGTITAAKHLMSGVIEHEACAKRIALLRTWWASVSLPWFDSKGAPRAVNALGVTDLQVEIGGHVREITELWKAFMSKYPELRAHRQYEMGAFFDAREFPSPQEMQRRFAIRVDWYPLPDTQDIRVMDGISPEDAKRLADDAAESERKRLAFAMGAAAKKLYKAVKSMHDTMATPIGEKGAKFNDTKLDNILAIAELIPSLNLTNDPKLAALAKEAKKLATKSPGELREDEVKRKAAAKEAEGLAAKLAGMFTADDDADDDEA